MDYIITLSYIVHRDKPCDDYIFQYTFLTTKAVLTTIRTEFKHETAKLILF